jgi:hypothetical protein
MARRADHEGLVCDEHPSRRGVEYLRLHHRQMALEGGLIVGGEKILRSPPRPFAFDHRVNGNVADPDLPHRCVLPGVSGTA